MQNKTTETMEAMDQPEMDQSKKDVSEQTKMMVYKSQADLEQALMTMDFEKKMEFLTTYSEFVGAPIADTNLFLNKRILLLGCLIHEATVAKTDEAGDAITYLDDNGEEVQKYITAERTVFKFVDPETGDGEYVLGFVSMSIANFAKTILIPAFGVGNWQHPVPVIIRQAKSRGGRVFNMQVVK